VNKNNQVNIEISKNEAIVLFEFLERFNQIKNKKIFEDQAEQRVLWDLESILENKLVELFNENYKEIVYNARQIVRDEK